MQCRLNARGTKREPSSHPVPFTPRKTASIIDSPIHHWVKNPASPPPSIGYGYWQNKSNSTQWELTPPECICMHIKSMQHSTQIMTTSDIINHHQPQHDIITYHEINHPKA